MPRSRQLAAIMFTDIVGYTALMGEDEEKAFELLKKNRLVQRPIIEEHNGRWLKEIGDGVLASFNAVSEAVYCAGAIQKACENEPDLKLRIGIHEGEVVFEDNDVFGDGVNIASRLEPLAPIGGILVSEAVHKNVLNKKGITTILVGEKELKGVREPVRVYQVQVEGVEIPEPKTSPSIASSNQVEHAGKKTSNQRKIIWGAVAIILVVIGYIFYANTNGTENASETEIVEKSIAVIPFKSLSGDPEKQYLADGVMDAILLHLSKIENLRVITRTSVEQYRNTTMTIPEIAAELNVHHILEGTFQKHGDRANLIVQLSDAQQNEDHIWANEYNRDWSDIFAVQSEVSQAIARELQAVITPEEKQRIEKIPTANLTAYDFYQRGREEHVKYLLDNNNRKALDRAEDLYHQALEYDSTFAQAYTGLAQVYFNKYYWETFLTVNFLDSMLVLADMALSFDDQLAEAYVIKGNYYRSNNEKEQAIIEYDKAIEFNPNFGQAYLWKSNLYFFDDLVKTIDNLQKAASLQRGPFLPAIYRSMGSAYATAGFKEKANYYIEEALKLDDDSAEYYGSLAQLEDGVGNYQKAIEFGEKSYSIDSTDYWTIYLLGIHHMFLGQNEESLEYMKKWRQRLDSLNRLNPFGTVYFGYAYLVNGFKEEAEYYFNTGLEFQNEIVELGRHYNQEFSTFYNLAAIYTILGDKDKAYENLRLVNQRPRIPLWMLTLIKNDPLFDSIRGEPEFQQIVKDVEAKYQAEHERVRVWLEEEGML